MEDNNTAIPPETENPETELNEFGLSQEHMDAIARSNRNTDKFHPFNPDADIYGISLRDYIAIQAMTAIIHNHCSAMSSIPGAVAQGSYLYADAMIEQSKK